MDLSILTRLASIVLVDLVLSGDNALVIGMAARTLPAEQRKKAILWGTVAAIALRVAFTLAAAALLYNFPGIRLVGGMVLLWVAVQLLVDASDQESVRGGRSLAEAIRIVLVADAVMSLDNILAVAGASHGHLGLLVIGLLLSMPLLMGGATLVAAVLDRQPWITWLGSAAIGWIAGEMIVGDPLWGHAATLWHWIGPAAATGLVLIAAAAWRARKKA
jgi:YjbE family integral membrane protein